MAVSIARFNCRGRPLAVLDLPDRRAAAQRHVRFLFLSELEKVLYGGSTGAIYRLLQRESMERSVLPIKKASVGEGLVTQPEFDAILEAYRETVEAVETRGRVRMCSLVRVLLCDLNPPQWSRAQHALTSSARSHALGNALTRSVRARAQVPLPVAVSCAKSFGRSPQAIALLECFSAPLPRQWELLAEQEANAAAGEVSLLLEDELAAEEELEAPLEAELHYTHVAYEETPEEQATVARYKLDRVPAALEAQLQQYKDWRLQPLNFQRAGNAVVDTTAYAPRNPLEPTSRAQPSRYARTRADRRDLLARAGRVTRRRRCASSPTPRRPTARRLTSSCSAPPRCRASRRPGSSRWSSAASCGRR